MNRREAIGGIGGSVASLIIPGGARAAHPIIGFLDSGSSEGFDQPLAGFKTGLTEEGLREGQSYSIEYRWANGRYDQLPELAGDLVRQGVSVIAATRGPGPARAAKAVTTTIPIVFQTGSDPVKDGLVSSLSRPGGNVTGASRLSTDLIPKRLERLAEIVPNAKSVALLVNPAGPQAQAQIAEMRTPVAARGMAFHTIGASNERELDEIFRAYEKSGASALLIANDQLFIARRDRIIEQALRHRIPTSFSERELVFAGGLMSYAASFSDLFRQAGVLVGRILKGAKPADLPVLQPVKFEFVINLKTAKILDLVISFNLQAAADEVVE